MYNHKFTYQSVELLNEIQTHEATWWRHLVYTTEKYVLNELDTKSAYPWSSVS